MVSLAKFTFSDATEYSTANTSWVTVASKTVSLASGEVHLIEDLNMVCDFKGTDGSGSYTAEVRMKVSMVHPKTGQVVKPFTSTPGAATSSTSYSTYTMHGNEGQYVYGDYDLLIEVQHTVDDTNTDSVTKNHEIDVRGKKIL